MSIIINNTSEETSSSESIKDILNDFPIGIILIESDSLMEFTKTSKILYANEYGRHLLKIPNDDDIGTFLNNISMYKEYNPAEVITSTLKDAILNINSCNIAKIFISPTREMLYVKIKCTPSKILLSIDDLQEERRVIQSNFLKKVNYQYLLTLYHEINNPLNSLVASVNDIIQKAESITTIIKRITLLVLLIQFFLKNFILYFQVSMMINSDMTKERKSTFHLNSLLKKIAKKFESLYDYKQILYQNNTESLSNKATTLNYFYFKTLLRMIFSYYYYILEKGLCLVVQCEKVDQTKLRLIFTNDNSIEILSKSFNSLENNDNNEYDTTTENELNQKNKIQTLDMILSTLNQLSSILKIKLTHLDNENVTITLIIPYENDHQLFNYDDYTELSPNHDTVVRMIDRSLAKFSLNDLNNNTTNNNNNTNSNYEDNDTSYLKESNQLANIKLVSIFKRKKNAVAQTMSSKTEKRVYIEDIKRSSFKKIHSVKHKKKLINIIDDSQSFADENNDIIHEEFDSKINNNEKPNKEVNQHLNDYPPPNDNNGNHLKVDLADIKNKFGYIENEFRRANSNTMEMQKLKMIQKEEEKKISEMVPTKKITESLKSKYNDIQSIPYRSIINHLTTSLKPSISLTHRATCLIPCQCNDVLIVDDEFFNLSCLTNILLKKNIRSDSANDGKECLEKVIAKASKNCSCPKSYYKLILLDILMPKVSGMEAAEEIMKYVRINAIPQSISIIFISACLDKEQTIDDIIKKIPIVKAFLSKPIKRTKIEELLKDYYKSSKDK